MDKVILLYVRLKRCGANETQNPCRDIVIGNSYRLKQTRFLSHSVTMTTASRQDGSEPQL